MEAKVQVLELSLEDLKELIESAVSSSVDRAIEKLSTKERRPLRGVKAVCEYLGISKSKYYSMLKDKRFSTAVNSHTRKVFVYTDRLDDAIKQMRG